MAWNFDAAVRTNILRRKIPWLRSIQIPVEMPPRFASRTVIFLRWITINACLARRTDKHAMANVRATVNNMNGTKERSHGLQLDWHLNAQEERFLFARVLRTVLAPKRLNGFKLQSNNLLLSRKLMICYMVHSVQVTRYINVAYYTYYWSSWHL